MESKWDKDYPLLEVSSEAELDDNSSLKKMLQLVGNDKKVIDFGCATGYLARLLKARDCQVTGIEISPKAAQVAERYCDRVIVADLDFTPLSEILPEQSYDVAVFGDVLEHLRDPWKVLEALHKILTPEGFVVASIPNVAHGAVRLALLSGKFEYEQLGLLDNTHLRFFTRKTVQELFEKSGYSVDAIDRTIIPVFSETTWVPRVSQGAFSPELIQQVEQDEDSDTLQFVFRAFPLSPEGQFAALKTKYAELLGKLEQSAQQEHNQSLSAELQLRQVQAELQEAKTQLHQAQADLHQAKTQSYEANANLYEAKTQLHKTQIEASQVKEQLYETQSDLETAKHQIWQLQTDAEVLNHRLTRIKAKRQEIRAARDKAQNEINAMQTSKFWKLREKWFRFKNLLGRGK